jgi:hypothetical protein
MSGPGILGTALAPGVRPGTGSGSIERKYGRLIRQTYVDALPDSEARPLRRDWRSHPAAGVTAEEFEGVIGRSAGHAQLATIFPEELLKRHMRRGRRDTLIW